MKQCASYTAKGTRCLKLINDPETYCHIHLKKPVPKPESKKCLLCERPADLLKSMCASCHKGKRWRYRIRSADDLIDFINVTSGETVSISLSDMARILHGKIHDGFYRRYDLGHRDMRHIIEIHNRVHPESTLVIDDVFSRVDDVLKNLIGQSGSKETKETKETKDTKSRGDTILQECNIHNREDFVEWAKANHPDRFTHITDKDELQRINLKFATVYKAGKEKF